jgi:hypothetical protein
MEEADMTDIEQLMAIEAIKRLKSRYFWCLDHQDWEGWKRDVWAPDASLDVPGSTEGAVAGVDNIIAWTAPRANGQISIHHGHMPDIEITSDTTAKGVWAMEDILHKPLDHKEKYGYHFLHGWGHYHETYVKLAQGWRIKTTKLTRLRVVKG